jgi:hypothetical protein
MGVAVTEHGDRGEANALGLVLIAPLAIALAVLILWIGRKVDTDAQVQAASSAAAQSAVLQRTPSAATAAARSTAAAMLTDAKACEGAAVVSVDTSDFRPGGTVTVAVSCSPQRSDLSLAAAKSVTFAATATASIDTHRSAGLP